MSLTSFLKNKDVKERFRQEFSKPKFSQNKEILAPPITKRYALMGTAFDYLMRFYLERLNPSATSKTWVAEISADSLDSGFPYLESSTELAQRAKEIIIQAKKDHANYLKSGMMNEYIIKSAISLAQLDPIYRAGVIDKNMGIIDEGDIEDLKNLISIVDPELFKANKTCSLNPTFGVGSQLVGGADIDLVIDAMLIDIKTTKFLDFKRDYFNQLLGYYALYKIGGIDGLSQKHEIKTLGIYFSRHGILHSINVADVVNENTFPRFLEWLKVRASEEFQ